MKKWIVLYLVFNVLAFAMPTGYTVSMFKLGGLISHFHDHKHDSSETGFLSFIADHYLEKKHHEADHGDHEKLPFHDHHNEGINFASQSPSIQPVLLSAFTASKVIIQSGMVISEVTDHPLSTYLGDIWQPPKA